nr:MAG TPA: hypothetical protein [Caudoviricetes sp.]
MWPSSKKSISDNIAVLFISYNSNFICVFLIINIIPRNILRHLYIVYRYLLT